MTPATPQPRQLHPPRNRPTTQIQSSAWERELNKTIGREVVVTQFVGTNHEGLPLYLDHVGVCVAIHHQHLSVVLMTDEEKILLKNVASIRRKRTKNNAPKPAPAASDTVEALATAASQLGNILGETMKGAPE